MPATISACGAACEVTTCVAFGSYTDKSGDQEGLLDTETGGGAWTSQEAPLPGPAASNPDVKLLAAACQSAASCTAVGYYTGANGNGGSLLVDGLGLHWAAGEKSLPSTPDGGSSLNAIACPASGSCTAIGVEGNGSVIQTGSGSNWTTPVPDPEPTGVTGVAVTHPWDVACGATTTLDCVVASTWGGGSTTGQFLATGSGTSWTPVVAPALQGYTSTVPEGLACTDNFECVMDAVNTPYEVGEAGMTPNNADSESPDCSAS
jgi:hypothetical protein